jgi:predicted nuclease with TOPRIM domain
MKEKLLELLNSHERVSDELLELESQIEIVKNQIGEMEATEILMSWLNEQIADA